MKCRAHYPNEQCKPKVERNATIVAMRESGMSYKEIARQHNISISTTWKIYKRETTS